MRCKRLSELAFACYIYGRMTDYDSSYQDFLRTTNHMPDLKRAEHRTALIDWLNKWGCRQFAKDYHSLASQQIEAWHQRFSNSLFPTDRTLLQLSDEDISVVEAAYGALAERTASMRKTRGGTESVIMIGPTGAAKVLFAIRPNALVPWDTPIREALGLDGSAHSYAAYLGIVRTQLQELEEACGKNGCKLSELPKLIGRSESSLVKLIDEYYWVTVTRKCPAPPNDVLARWMAWK